VVACFGAFIFTACSTLSHEREAHLDELQRFADDVVRVYALPPIRVWAGSAQNITERGWGAFDDRASSAFYNERGIIYLDEKILDRSVREATVAKGMAFHKSRSEGARAWNSDPVANVNAVAILERFKALSEEQAFDRVRRMLLTHAADAQNAAGLDAYTPEVNARLRARRVSGACARLGAFDRAYPRYPRDLPEVCVNRRIRT